MPYGLIVILVLSDVAPKSSMDQNLVPYGFIVLSWDVGFRV